MLLSWMQLHTVLIFLAFAMIPGFFILFYLLSSSTTAAEKVIPVATSQENKTLNIPSLSLKEKLSRAIDVSKQLHELLGSSGRELTIHSPRGIKHVNLFSYGSELRWEAIQASGAMKKYKLDLRDVLFVETGKKTKNFQMRADVDDEKCFSLVSRLGTLDIEVSSKDERRNFLAALTDCLQRLDDDHHLDS
jgi:hypothetical protein